MKIIKIPPTDDIKVEVVEHWENGKKSIKEEKGTMRQINCTTTVDGTSIYWISEHSDDGYVGILTDTVYEDGSDYTDWCQFVGTQEECEAYIKAKED